MICTWKNGTHVHRNIIISRLIEAIIDQFDLNKAAWKVMVVRTQYRQIQTSDFRAVRSGLGSCLFYCLFVLLFRQDQESKARD